MNINSKLFGPACNSGVSTNKSKHLHIMLYTYYEKVHNVKV